MIVDVHAHALPIPLLDWLSGQGLAEVGDGVVRIDPQLSAMPAGAPIPLPAAQYDLEVRLADLQRTGVTRQLVSLPPFVTGADARDADLVAETVRRGNDALAEFAAGHHGVVDPLGFVPLGTSAAVAEAKRCLDELGCAGIAIGTRGVGRELDAPEHEPLWEFLAERRVFVFLHPNSVPGGGRLADYWLPQLAGFPMETAVAVSRLILGGVLERHRLTLCLAHGGGCLPALQGRLDLGWSRKPVAHTTPYPPSEYLRRLYYDTATFSTPLLRRLVEDFGADHLLVGTDYPFELADTDPISTVAALGLADGERTLIEEGTIAGLLHT
ncbi:amidohydrolase family protein [Amycolatopsis jejuensis]|uniref:amidohydrolase family protein n=1 Tax=Amycolatopsis jejuensis TaxID=330084 RepID=UPI00068DF159|nr:amidohydrolase family protein [Amycolatopsis jejuensis]